MGNKPDLSQLNCKNCKGLMIKPPDYDEKINYWRSLQMDAIKDIKSIRLYLLIPFLSPDRFFYDLNTDAWHRNDLKRIMLKGSSDEEFIRYLSNHGIVIVECCFCPLHRFFLHSISLTIIPKVISNCLKKHNLHLLNIQKAAPIITLFEGDNGLNNNSFANQNSRIIKNFELHHLVKSNKRFLKLVESLTRM